MVRSSRGGSGPKKGPLERKKGGIKPFTPTVTDEINRLLKNPVAAKKRLFPEGRYSIAGFDRPFIFPVGYKRFLEEVPTRDIAKVLGVNLTLAKKLKKDINEHGELTEETLRWFLVEKLATKPMKQQEGYR